MSFQPFHPLKKDVPKLTRRKSKKVREDLIPSSFDSEFGNFKSSRKNFTLFELQDATDDFSHGRDKRLVKSLVVGRPILLALEDIDGGPSFLEKALRFLEKYRTKVKGILKQLADVEEVDRIVQEYEQAFRRYEATWWLRKVVGVIAAKDLPTKPSKEEFNLLTFLGLFV
ncbi:uncharacterized protein LOC107634400 isoform X2 [Arachis ipaensis]|uniref:Uncharacterized protein n=1 Tax=Arachis hypogaea TaxID=3818 RepID=A0A445A2E2_ARAHY|nr:uncharacterized protein LOC107634400 isoform X2 [Arachis ipaensis]XP_025644299.1 uncharacterized protein LOC112738184 isoform X2 [Arachis hypogaea]RYR20599.1 hypothetical protein Ahy_B03g065784 isoform A [Arachis hypogaea]